MGRRGLPPQTGFALGRGCSLNGLSQSGDHAALSYTHLATYWALMLPPPLSREDDYTSTAGAARKRRAKAREQLGRAAGARR
eukprot:263023-Pyramimonas_sp.AAC.1